ncbi:MAG: DNA-primase RepB domain-containing protein [Candidatus Acidiferrales bacterium]
MNKMVPFSRKILAASDYILALHSPEDRVAAVIRNRPRGQTMQRILPAEAIASPTFLYWLMEQNQAGADIFLGLNPIKPHCYSRARENIREIRHVYLDLDENAVLSLQALRSSGAVPAPNFVLDTSLDKNQVIWRVEGLDREQATALLRSLATQFQGDMAATDISRVFRVPGFANRKYKEQFLVRAIQESNQIHHLQDFALDPDSPDSPRHLGDSHGRASTLRQGHRSQSEADWAYAKRALARGDDPEIVIGKIADYRSEDKADPDYYARLTVMKASAQLHTHRPTDSKSLPGDHPETTVDFADSGSSDRTRM